MSETLCAYKWKLNKLAMEIRSETFNSRHQLLEDILSSVEKKAESEICIVNEINEVEREIKSYKSELECIAPMTRRKHKLLEKLKSLEKRLTKLNKLRHDYLENILVQLKSTMKYDTIAVRLVELGDFHKLTVSGNLMTRTLPLENPAELDFINFMLSRKGINIEFSAKDVGLQIFDCTAIQKAVVKGINEQWIPTTVEKISIITKPAADNHTEQQIEVRISTEKFTFVN